MKKLLIVPMLLFVFISSNYAQERKREARSPEQRAEMMTKRLTEQLSLTKEQQDEVHKVILERSQNSNTENRDRRASSKEFQQKISSVLTPEQQTKWKEANKRQMEQRKRGADSPRRSSGRKAAPKDGE